MRETYISSTGAVPSVVSQDIPDIEEILYLAATGTNAATALQAPTPYYRTVLVLSTTPSNNCVTFDEAALLPIGSIVEIYTSGDPITVFPIFFLGGSNGTFLNGQSSVTVTVGMRFKKVTSNKWAYLD